MIWKIVVCIACAQAVAVGVVNSKSLLVQPHHPSSYTAVRGPLIFRDRPYEARRHQNIPRHPGGRRFDPLSVTDGSHGRGRDSAQTCDLCPTSHDILPCACQCLNKTAAMIKCGPELVSCSQLTEVMSLTSYPVNPYSKLVIANTNLACNLEKELWGPLMFHEIEITNNRFQVLDNRAFQPFSATLTTLNLEGNTLKDVYFATISDTPLLRYLNLSNNNVEFLPGYSTMSLPQLETFDASKNRIPFIIHETFAGMPKLRMIDLSQNAITKLYAKAFSIPRHDASSLTINLADNLISFIEAGVMDGVRMCSIDLQNNHLTILPENVFRPIIDLTAAAAVFYTNDNPFDCDTQFCWIATNETVNDSFSTVLCPNLNNDPVDVLIPVCSIAGTPKTPQHQRRRLNVLPNPDSSLAAFRENEASPAVRDLRNPPLQRP